MGAAAVPEIVILGSPRSGTSWLGKIFDSHPKSLYRMEPDTILQGDYPFTGDDIYTQQARAHLQDMAELRTLKVTGSRPIFQKSGQSVTALSLRKSMLYSFKALECVHPVFGRMNLPDFCSRHDKTLVMKTVSGLGRGASWAAAFPKTHFIHILRHPCGHTYSTLRGQSGGHLNKSIPLGFEECRIARKYQITRDRLIDMEEDERIAWRWVIQNETFMSDVPAARTVTYEDLCRDPFGTAVDLFRSSGLTWHQQTETFLEESTTSGNGSYFEVKRDPLTSANAWKEHYDRADYILSMIAHTAPAQIFVNAVSRAIA